MTLNIIDDEASGTIDVSPSGSLAMTEGESQSLDISLSDEPDFNVTVSLSSENSHTAFSPETLTFTKSNYSTAQTVTVLATHDNDNDRDDTDTITLSATGGFFAPDVEVAVAITDDEFGLHLTATSLELDEGEQGTFQVILGTQPSEDVTVTVRSSFRVASVIDTDPNTAGDQNTLVFARSGTTDAWNESRTVTILATPDDDARDETATISLTATGGEYQGESASVSVAITDDETPRILAENHNLSVLEGDCSSFGIRPATRPTANIEIYSYVAKQLPFNPSYGYAQYTHTSDIWTYPSPKMLFNQYGQTHAWNEYRDLRVCAHHDDDQDDGIYVVTVIGSGGITNPSRLSLGT